MPGVISFAYPSKTATYLAEGLPLLVMVEPESGLARQVEDERIGFVLPRTKAGLRDALGELAAATGDERDSMRARARAVFHREYASEQLLERWAELLDDPRVSR